MSTTFNPTEPFKTTTSTSGNNYWQMPSYNTGTSSVGGFNLPDTTTAVQNQRTAGQGMLANQGAQTGKFLSNYAGAIGGQETMPAMYQRLSTELGLPNLQKVANQGNETLAALPETYGNATRGFDVNANQLSRIIGTKTAQLSPSVQRANAAAQNASQQVGQQMGLMQQQQAKELQPYEYEKSFLTDRLARETSMFTQDNQNELQALTNKMNAGITLSEGEKNRAQQLTVLQKQYENQRALAEQKFGYDQKLNDPLGLFS